MKILHVASFDGNIGDRANHAGFYRFFKKYITANFDVTQLEIRNFYKAWNLRKFDMAFAEEANKYDLLVFGGGAFWEPRWDYSATGTTIDLNDEVLDALKIPVLFNGIGLNRAKGTTELAIARFHKFLKKITASPQFFVSVRNDGSKEELKALYGTEFETSILKVPDGGYLINPEPSSHPEIVKGKKHIAICLGGDMTEVRFNQGQDQISRQKFVEKLATICDDLLLNDDIRIVFAPHIFSDLKMIYEVLELMNDKLVRTKVNVAPLLNGTATDGMLIFDLYRHCDLVLSMRHHGNICPIALGVPTIGILNYASHVADYKEMGLEHRYVLANEAQFAFELEKKMANALACPANYIDENKLVTMKVETLGKQYFKNMGKWLSEFNLL